MPVRLITNAELAELDGALPSLTALVRSAGTQTAEGYELPREQWHKLVQGTMNQGRPGARATAVSPPADEVELLRAVEKGLGDEVHRLAAMIGAERLAKLWEHWTGRSCNCAARQKWLNQRFPGGWRQLLGLSSGSST